MIPLLPIVFSVAFHLAVIFANPYTPPFVFSLLRRTSFPLFPSSTARPPRTLAVRARLDDHAVHKLEYVDVFQGRVYLHFFFK